ncbi:MAG: YhbY family RNA-binding protein [Gallionella sp.]
MLSLTVTERRELKAKAHPLNPVVMIGNAGLTPPVLAEIAASLKVHELIKIRVMSDDRALRDDILNTICSELDAAPVQHIGKILVIYLANPDAHQIEIKKMPRHKGKKPLSKKQLASRG